MEGQRKDERQCNKVKKYRIPQGRRRRREKMKDNKRGEIKAKSSLKMSSRGVRHLKNKKNGEKYWEKG